MRNTHYSASGLAILSHHKLEQETAAEEPDLRRCLGHNSVLSNTMSKTRKNSDRYRKSFQLREENVAASSPSTSMKKDKEQDKGSLIRAQIAKTVKAMVRRRSLTATPANTITTDININATTAGRKETKLVQIPVEIKTSKNTTTTNRNNNRTVQFKGDNQRMTPAPSTPSPAKNVLSTKSRQCMALVTGRKFWMHSMMVQTSAG